MEWEEDEEGDTTFAIASDRKTRALGSCFCLLGPLLDYDGYGWHGMMVYAIFTDGGLDYCNMSLYPMLCSELLAML